MICRDTRNKMDSCNTILSYRNNSSNSNIYRSSKYYRPLQQIYKTVYSPIYGNKSLPINFACISRPLERYKTTNMSYGSFHYDNWAFIQKNRSVNYNRKQFVRCYE
jgi:hypothetical protein